MLVAIILSFQVNAQNSCMLDPVNSNDCGSGFVSFSPVGENVFCEGSDVILQNNSSITDFEFFYIDWGDGQIDTIDNYDNISHAYDFIGLDRCEAGPEFNQFFCIVGVKSCAEGTTANFTQTVITVRLNPVAAFETPQQACVGIPFSPANNSCNGETFLWDFGNGQTSTEENPSFQYDAPGNYTITLNVTNACNTETTTRNIEVVPPPEALFSYTPTAPEDLCNPATVTFTNETVVGNTTWAIIPNDTLAWRFTDTTMNFSSRDIRVRFIQPGTYTVRLTATNACPEDVAEIELVINEAPRIQLNDISPSCDEITLTSTDIIDRLEGSIDNLQWTFENGSPGSATGETFGPITFASSGRIILNAESPCGNIERTVDVVVASTGSYCFWQ